MYINQREKNCGDPITKLKIGVYYMQKNWLGNTVPTQQTIS